jgi:hypothetical protein
MNDTLPGDHIAAPAGCAVEPAGTPLAVGELFPGERLRLEKTISALGVPPDLLGFPDRCSQSPLAPQDAAALIDQVAKLKRGARASMPPRTLAAVRASQETLDAMEAGVLDRVEGEEVVRAYLIPAGLRAQVRFYGIAVEIDYTVPYGKLRAVDENGAEL